MKTNRLAVLVALGLGLVVAARAEAEPTCQQVSGKYDLERVTAGCSALRCYEGDFAGAGILSGSVRITITGFILDLPGSTALWAYSARTEIETRSHGNVVYENFGFFVPDPSSNNPLQTDTALVVSGTDDFESASGHSTSIGFAVVDLTTGLPLQLVGDVSGEICLEK